MSSSETVVYDDIPVIQTQELTEEVKDVEDACVIDTNNPDKLPVIQEEVITENVIADEEVVEEANREEVVTETTETGEEDIADGQDEPAETGEAEAEEEEEDEGGEEAESAENEPAKARTAARRSTPKRVRTPARKQKQIKRLVKKKTPVQKAKTPRAKATAQPASKAENAETEAMTSSPQDSSLPEGWYKRVVQRQSGATAGRCDVYIFSPDNRKFRSRTELSAYLDEINSPLFIDQFTFNVNKSKSSDNKVTPARKKTAETKKVKPTPPPAPPVSRKRKATPVEQSPPRKKLVVKMSFGNSSRRTIKTPARYSNSPMYSAREEPEQIADNVEVETPKTETPTRKRTGRPRKNKEEKIHEEQLVFSEPENSDIPEVPDVLVETPKPKRGRKKKVVTPAVESEVPPVVHAIDNAETVETVEMPEVAPPVEDVEMQEVVDVPPQEEIIESTVEEVVTEDNVIEERIVDSEPIVEQVEEEVVTETVAVNGDAAVATDNRVTRSAKQATQATQSSQSEWVILPEDSLKTTIGGSDLFSLVKNSCVRSLWKMK